MRQLTRKTTIDRTRDEAEQIFSKKQRVVFHSPPDVQLLPEGEPHFYEKSDGTLYFVIRRGAQVYYSSQLSTTEP